MKCFETFRISGLRFLAIHKSNSVLIVDENGGNHGGWFCIDNFKKEYKEGGGTKIGICILSHTPISEEPQR